jgi:hypothetical protein
VIGELNCGFKLEKTRRKNAVKYGERSQRTQLENTIGAKFIESSKWRNTYL